MSIQTTKINFIYLIFLAFVSAMGGVLFGYDWVVIGGAKPFYEIYFNITDNATLQGWAMSSALLGCIIGAVGTGFVADRLGRKIPLIVSAILFTIASIGTGAVDSLSLFVFYRLIGGIGIGVASTLSPLYIAEISPSAYRGRLVAINQLTIVAGILGAQIINYFIAEPIVSNATSLEMLNSWNCQEGWRWMFWACAIPAGAFFLLMFFLPESPRFLVTVGRINEAEGILNKIGNKAYAQEELQNIKSTIKQDEMLSKEESISISNPKVLPILLIGIVLAIFQQWCGINIIFNYADDIFKSAGYSVGEMLFNIVITGTVNFIFTILAMFTVDKWGRRKLMLLGSLSLFVIYLLLGASYYFNITGLPILMLVITAIAIYAMSLAPITWVVLSEIFPNKIRGTAMAISTFALWVSCFALTFTFPILNSNLGAYGIFWLYGAICLIAFIFIKAKLPETKNKSLEEIEKEFNR